MQLFKKGAPAAQPPETPKPKKQGGGRVLLAYFLPTVIVALATFAVIAVIVQQTLSSGRQEQAEQAAGTAATALAQRVAGLIQARSELLHVVARQIDLTVALADGADSQREAAEQRAFKMLPKGIMRIRLLSPDDIRPMTDGDAPMGYAGVDMAQRAASGKPVPAEAHQIASGAPYIAMATRVRRGGIDAVVFAAWSPDILAAAAVTGEPSNSSLWIRQGDNANFALAGKPDASPDGTVAIPGTIWSVAYRVGDDGGSGGDWLLLGAVLGAGALIMLLLTFLQVQRLGKDLRTDLTTVLHLGEAIAHTRATPATGVCLAPARDTVLLLAELARGEGHGDDHAARSARQAPTAPKAQPKPHAPMYTPSTDMDVEEVDQATALAHQLAPRPDVPASLFRAYDVRGVVGRELTADVAEWLGRAFAALATSRGANHVAMARDVRASSPDLAAAFKRGLIVSGCHVVDLGEAPIGVLYHAMHTNEAPAGVMVTGSHNPASYNGFKLFIDGIPVDGDDLQQLRQSMLNDDFAITQGSEETRDLESSYLSMIADDLQLAHGMKVVVDGGNGAAGEVACKLLGMLGCDVVPLYCEPDGNFPNHHPDPSVPDNLEALKLEVQASQAAIGIAFDGDGDRIGVIDSNGEYVWPEHILMLLAADILQRHPGTDVVFDVKSSRNLASFILSNGGRPIMWQSGHTRMKAKMRETGALVGGEFSGHFFIKERWFGDDDALYVMVRVLELLALDPRDTAEAFADFPRGAASPEYQLVLPEGQSVAVMQAIQANARFDDARLIELDGLRMEFPHGWGLVRPSNTTPSLTFRFEADSEPSLQEVKGRFRDLLRTAAPEAKAPF